MNERFERVAAVLAKASKMPSAVVHEFTCQCGHCLGFRLAARSTIAATLEPTAEKIERAAKAMYDDIPSIGTRYDWTTDKMVPCLWEEQDEMTKGIYRRRTRVVMEAIAADLLDETK